MFEFQPFSGNFIFIDYYPLLDDNQFDEPIRNLRVKMQDYDSVGISETGSRQFVEENMQGRQIRKYDAKLQMLPISGLVPKTGDKVVVHDFNDVSFIVKEVSNGWDSINMIHNMTFKKRRTTPYVIYIGDRR
jgi:hypothetical protein